MARNDSDLHAIETAVEREPPPWTAGAMDLSDLPVSGAPRRLELVVTEVERQYLSAARARIAAQIDRTGGLSDECLQVYGALPRVSGSAPPLIKPSWPRS